MSALGWILALTVLAMVAAVVLISGSSSSSSQATQSPASLDDFSIPDNSSSRVVPIIYGVVYTKGNCIYYGNLTSQEITATP